MCARDFDLVIEGGTSNKGHLIELLETPELRAGGVDTEWLDRRQRSDREEAAFGVEALVAAAILRYQRERSTARRNFYADPANPAPARVPPSLGLQIDLTHRATSYRLHVRALGAWRYRVRLDDREVGATLREEDAHAARLVLGGRTLRILADAAEAGVRLEVEGYPHRFGAHGVGQVRAPTPAMVVAVGVAPGDRVAAGDAVGVLEAMKTEIAVAAPVAGIVTEVLVRPGQQVCTRSSIRTAGGSSAGAGGRVQRRRSCGTPISASIDARWPPRTTGPCHRFRAPSEPGPHALKRSHAAARLPAGLRRRVRLHRLSPIARGRAATGTRQRRSPRGAGQSPRAC